MHTWRSTSVLGLHSLRNQTYARTNPHRWILQTTPLTFFEDFCGRSFWNITEAWQTAHPTLGRCVERTALTWGPCLFLWVCAPPALVAMHHRPSFLPAPAAPLPWLPRLACKLVLSVMVMATALAEVAVVIAAAIGGDSSGGSDGAGLYPSPLPPPPLPVDLAAPVVLLVSYGVAVVMVAACRRVGQRSSGLLFIFWGLMVVCGVPQLKDIIAGLHTHPQESLQNTTTWEAPLPSVHHPALATTFLLQYCGAALLLLLNCFADPAPRPKGSTKGVKESPEEAASFLSRITFHWVTQLLWKGWCRPLTKEDLWSLPPKCRSETVDATWRNAWSRELSYRRRKALSHIPKETSTVSSTNTGGSGSGGAGLHHLSVLRVALRAYLWPYLFSFFLLLAADMMLFLTPWLLGSLISFTTAVTSEPTWHGYLYAVGLLLANTLISLLREGFFQRAFKVCARLRASLMMAVYRKALTISPSARKESTAGEIVNHMSVDAFKVSDLSIMSSMGLVLPFFTIVAVWQLWNILGPSVLAGLAVMVLLMPLNAAVAKRLKELQTKQMKLKDKRIKISSEIISGIKVLKLNAWEEPFKEQVQKVRKEEIQLLTKATYLEAITVFLWFLTPYLVSLATFTTYILVSEDNVLDAETAFISIALFNLLRIPITQLSSVLAMGIQAKVSLSRLEKFFAAPNVDPNAVYSDPKIDSAINVEGGTFSWGGAAVEWALQGVELKVQQGQLVAVVGPVGAGKSSLLSALLGQMDKTSGHVLVNGQVAYVSQEAWLQNTTLRENITWGQPFEERRFRMVVNACALQPDFDILPGGDLTEVGEKGINLSGGQKQRVALARAAYSDADVVLLDDPLSAVDAHVGKQIFDCLLGPSGLMASKTRVLVTHSLWLLPRVDYVVVVEGGQLVEQGTCGELLEKEGTLARLLLHHINKKMEKGEDEEELKEEEVEKEEEGEEDQGLEELCEQLEHIPGAQALLRQISRQSSKSHHQVDSPRPSSHHRLPGATTTTNNYHRKQDSTSPPPYQNTFSRKFSSTSTISTSPSSMVEGVGDVEMKEKGLKLEGQLVKEEFTQTGRVGWSVYQFYAKSVGHVSLLLPLLFFFVGQSCQAGSNIWLSYWSTSQTITTTVANTTAAAAAAATNITNTTANVEEEEFDRLQFLFIYASFGVGQAIFIYLSLVMLRRGCLKAGRRIHDILLDALLHLPIHFFDTNPSGRVLNRLSKETNVLDSVLPMMLVTGMGAFTQVVTTLLVVIGSAPWVGLVVVPVMALYFILLGLYTMTHRQVRRIESAATSPIYTFFRETVQGVSTIRAFKKQESFIESCQAKINAAMQGFLAMATCNRWLAVRLECAGNLIVFSAAIFAVVGRGSVSPGIVGLSITYALNITVILNYFVRMCSEIEANIVSVERIKEYIEEEKEAPWRVQDAPQKLWPHAGGLVFKGYKARYRPELELVLHGVSCSVTPGEKVGIVGRTGAGKSSLTLGLFRIIEAAAGSIEVDGRDISKVGLHDLRSRITIIPQDPVLFSGTLRLNLDPAGILGDEEVWRALELAHLAPLVRKQPLGLSMMVEEGGANLSMGQRQLVGLARALLRKSPLLVLDEATAAVDVQTDQLIQTTIRAEFAECTVLTIAHRLNTILDSDKVMVMDQGRIAEFDSPSALLAQKDSIFYNMAKDAGLV
ncbi:ATP-binding cassette sub-family C member 3-like isoform X2 [Scylla paramamosain]|uniref:ATP-binding cassette sub-family C member 3-like isoform X2 n=1 Tax=Scylla paramamosain TaxID=85552 RepID=UPI003083009A